MEKELLNILIKEYKNREVIPTNKLINLLPSGYNINKIIKDKYIERVILYESFDVVFFTKKFKRLVKLKNF